MTPRPTSHTYPTSARLLHSLLCLAIALLPLAAHARESKDLMKANYYYRMMMYHAAIPYYEKAAAEANDANIAANLGDCYRFVGQPETAATWYGKAAAQTGCPPIVLLRYAKVLMQLTRYSDAERCLKLYQKTAKNDKRVQHMIAACQSAPGKLNATPAGLAILAGVNTSASEYAPTLWNGRLVFTADTAINVKKKSDKATGQSFTNMYWVHTDGNGQTINEYHSVADGKSVNNKFHIGPATFSADGKQMYYTRSKNRQGFLTNKAVTNSDSVVQQEIMIASGYDSSTGDFASVEPFPYNSEENTLGHPTVSPDGNLLVFATDMKGSLGGLDLFVSRKRGKSGWGKPESLGRLLNTEGDELFPWMPDSRTLYFASDGHEGLGGLDIYVCHWDAATNSFSAPQNVGTPINSPYDDISLALRADGGSSWFSSNRPAAMGSDNIYYFRKLNYYLHLTAIDSLTGERITGAQVVLATTTGRQPVAADAQGRYITQLQPATYYTAITEKTGYETRELRLDLTTQQPTADTIYQVVKLYKKPEPVAAIESAPPVATSFTQKITAPKVNSIYEIGHFYFAFNKADLGDSSKVILDSLAGYLGQHPRMRIQVRAHTDCRGTKEYNLKLSRNRANAVVSYLKSKGIPARRMEYIGLGNTLPAINCICEECTEQQHYQNRVLEFKVLEL